MNRFITIAGLTLALTGLTFSNASSSHTEICYDLTDKNGQTAFATVWAHPTVHDQFDLIIWGEGTSGDTWADIWPTSKMSLDDDGVSHVGTFITKQYTAQEQHFQHVVVEVELGTNILTINDYPDMIQEMGFTGNLVLRPNYDCI